MDEIHLEAMIVAIAIKALRYPEIRGTLIPISVTIKSSTTRAPSTIKGIMIEVGIC